MQDKEDASRGNNPPYISANIWQAFFDKMQRVNRPPRLSVELLREYGIPAGQAELQSALKFLGLIDNDLKTTDQFVAIQLKGDAFRSGLSQILQNAYYDLFEKHPLDHATYDDLQNYFAIKYSQASAKKMAKSFAVLCQMAGMNSPAFSKMRSMENAGRPVRSVQPDKEKKSSSEQKPSSPSGSRQESQVGQFYEDLVKEFIKTNPMPTGIQWDPETIKAFFDQYRRTINMLRGKIDDEEE